MNLQELANIDLLKELDLENIPQESQDELLSLMGEVLQQRIMLRVLEEMSDEDKNTFNGMLDNDTEEVDKIDAFLKNKVPRLDQITEEEIGKYKSEVLQIVKGSTQDLQ